MYLLPLSRTARLSLFGVLLGALGLLIAPPAQGQSASENANVTVDPALYDGQNWFFSPVLIRVAG